MYVEFCAVAECKEIHATMWSKGVVLENAEYGIIKNKKIQFRMKSPKIVGSICSMLSCYGNISLFLLQQIFALAISHRLTNIEIPQQHHKIEWRFDDILCVFLFFTTFHIRQNEHVILTLDCSLQISVMLYLLF